MEYFDAPEANPGQDGICSDNECPCGYPGATIPRGTGYLYISKDLVEFRRDARTVEQARLKLERIRAQTPGMMVMFDPSVSMPILMCEQGARKRGLDMEVAAADARYWWEHHKAPLRPTPLAKDKAAAPPVRKVSTAADAIKEASLSQASVPPTWISPAPLQPAWPPPIAAKTTRPNNAWIWWLVGSLSFLGLLAMVAVFIFTVSKNNDSKNPSIIAGAAGKALTVGSDFTWPPYEYIDDRGEYAGFDVELMKMIAEKIDAEITWENTPWDSLFGKVMGGQVDLAISAIGYSEERDATMDYSIPYLEIPDIFLVKKGFSGRISKPEDLAVYQVGVQLGTLQDYWLDTELVSSGVLDGEQILRYDDLDSAISDLLSQQSDVVIVDQTQAARYMALHPELQVAFERQNPESNLYIVFPTGSDELLQSVNRAIAELKSTGAIEQLYEEVFALSAYTQATPVTSKVVIWHAWNENEITSLNEVIDAFKAANPDVTFEVLYVPLYDLRNMFEIEVVTGGGPTVIIGPAEWGPALYNAGLIADLSADLDQKTLDTINPAALAAVVYKDALIGLPQELEGVVLFRNKAIVADAATDFADLLVKAEAATTGDITGAFLEYGFFFSAGHLSGVGGALMDAKGDPVFNNEKGVEWLNLLNSFNTDAVATNYTDDDVNLFKEGKVGWIIDGTWNASTLAEAIGAENLVVDEWPSPLSGYVVAENIYLNANAFDLDRAAGVAFLKFFLSAEAQALLADPTKAGHIPAIRGVELTDPIMNQEIAAFAKGAAFPVIPEMGIYWDPGNNATKKVILEGMDPAAALQEMFDAITAALPGVRGE